MTVSNSNNRTQLVADGTTTAFDFNFKIFSASELAVFVAGVVVVTGFTVSGIDQDSGGTVTFSQAPDNGVSVVMLRDMDFTQQADYLDGDPFSPEVHEKQLDRQTMMIQQIREESDRSIKIPVDSTSAPEIDPDVIQIVADNSDEIVDLAQDISAVVAVNDNQSNINNVADNLQEIGQVAGALSMTSTSLTLSLGDTEVPESIYTNLYDAVEYAKTVLQVGGKLTVNVPDGTFGPGLGTVVIDGRIRLHLIGTNSASSPSNRAIYSGEATTILIDGGYLYASEVMIATEAATINATALKATNNSSVILNDVKVRSVGSGSFALSTESGSFLNGVDIDLDSTSGCIKVDGNSSANISGIFILQASSDIGPKAIDVSGSSSMLLSGNANFTSANNTSIGVFADKGSLVTVTGTPTFSAFYATNYDPLEDTYGNFHSRIITTE